MPATALAGLLAVAVAAQAAGVDTPPPPASVKRAAPAIGIYQCVVVGRDSYFPTGAFIRVSSAGQYATKSSSGAYEYNAANRKLKFTSGQLAVDGATGIYYPGAVPKGIPRRKGPAIVLKPATRAASDHSATQHCYLTPEKTRKQTAGN